MNSSLKIGAFSGLIAGIGGGIVTFVFMTIGNVIGLPYTWAATPFPITQVAIIQIVLGTIWGSILGIIYSRGYDIIPGKSVWRGLFFSMIIFLVFSLRYAFAASMYGYSLHAVNQVLIGFPTWIAYGLVLGILYESLLKKYHTTREEYKIIKYDVKGGVFIGAIAGFIGGLVASIPAVLGPSMGVWKITGIPVALTLELWMSVVQTHLFYNMIWGAIFGAIFPKVYNLVPGNNIVKGLYYALVVFLITSVHTSTYYAAYSNFALAISWSFIGVFNAIVYGLVLGLLYKKPTEAPTEKQKDIQMVEMVNCIHCNASIPKGSKHCNECGKKQV